MFCIKISVCLNFLTLLLARRGEGTFSDGRDKLQVEVVTKNFVRQMGDEAAIDENKWTRPSDVSHSNWQTAQSP